MLELDILLPRNHFDLKIQEKFSAGITGVFGPSGAGKTSMLHAIAGLAKPKEGFIKIGDKPLFDREAKLHVPIEKRNIGYVFQEGRLFPHMKVEKNLRYGQKKKGNNQVSFDEVVELLQLGHLLDRKISQISGGESQRTALGRSLLSSPDLLLLDEPFSAVDMVLRKQILPFIIRIQQKFKIPILVVSHDLPDLLKLSDRLCLIREGKVIGHDSYYELLKKPELADLFGASSVINAIDMRVVQAYPESGLTILNGNGEGQEVRIKCEQSREVYRKGQEIKIFIQADDIALSKEKLENVSIQNQLKGKITGIIERAASQLCVVDVGFPLLVEISAESQKRMDIRKGSEIWCLFKSVAIDVAD
ncbi:MAG: molybdenum ABC transporter ATP-binding protein [Bacteroidia bacterium]|nr:molybdenum ABC transporter ATP-binding protein [Bacteroidia bacterium]